MSKTTLKASLISVAVIAIVISMIIYACDIGSPDLEISSGLVNTAIPKDTKVIQSSDSHGGFHGDGEYFVVFQLTESQYKEFLNKLSQNKLWTDLPLSDDLNKFIFGEKKIINNTVESYEGCCENKIPNNIKHGKYYFRDKYIEYYPEYKGTSVLDPKRYSHNFIFALLDSDNKRLYVIKSDS